MTMVIWRHANGEDGWAVTAWPGAGDADVVDELAPLLGAVGGFGVRAG
jgi:hypothetical protein